MTNDNLPTDFAEVVVVGLFEFEDGDSPALWWIGLQHFSPEFEGRWIDEDESHEFAESFQGSTCLETLPLHQASAAIDRACQIARERRLPLYRVTRYRDQHDDQHSVYELVHVQRGLAEPGAQAVPV